MAETQTKTIIRIAIWDEPCGPKTYPAVVGDGSWGTLGVSVQELAEKLRQRPGIYRDNYELKNDISDEWNQEREKEPYYRPFNDLEITCLRRELDKKP